MGSHQYTCTMSVPHLQEQIARQCLIRQLFLLT